MEILIRGSSDGRGRWTKITEHEYQSEASLQTILYKSPEIIPIEKLGAGLLEPKVFIKEAGLPGSGNTDLIGVDENGSITIIECKLASNPEVKRKVIGQVLEYAAYLWQMTYDQFDGICVKAEKWDSKNLADSVREKLNGNPIGWVESDFRAKVASNLSDGVFHLVIAVDSINEELKRTIQFLNSKGENSTRIYALEMRQFESKELGMQLLVPEVFGYSSPPPQGASGKKWNESDFFAAINSGQPPAIAHVARVLFDWAKSKGLRIWWGSGKFVGSFVMGIVVNHEESYPVVVSTNGNAVIQFGVLKTRLAFKPEPKRIELLQRLNKISGVHLPVDAIVKYPNLPMSNLVDSQSLQEFISILDWLFNEIEHKSSETKPV